MNFLDNFCILKCCNNTVLSTEFFAKFCRRLSAFKNYLHTLKHKNNNNNNNNVNNNNNNCCLSYSYLLASNLLSLSITESSKVISKAVVVCSLTRKAFTLHG